MTLFEKFGWVIPPEEYLESLESAKKLPKYEDDIPNQKMEVEGAATRLAIVYYLVGNLAESTRFARQAVWAALEYFHGAWKKEIKTDRGELDSDWWRPNIPWLDCFREGLCWAAALGDWRAVDRIADYPLDDCPVDIGYTRQDRAVYLSLASFLRGESSTRRKKHLDAAVNGKKQKPKLLAAIVGAIQAKNQTGFEESMRAYFSYFCKTEFTKKSMDRLLSIDGTTLVHVGERAGLASPSHKSADWIFVLP